MHLFIRPRTWVGVFIFLASLLSTGSALAQDYRGKIQGFVMDATQAAVPGAKVVLRNTHTGIEASQQSDNAGHYLFEFVEPGTYSVRVEAAGFARFMQEAITMLTRGDVTVNVQLKVGSITQEVSVTAAPPLLEFNTSTMSTTVTGTMLKELPVEGRNPFTLAILNPAVVNQYWDVPHRNPFFMQGTNGMDVGGSTGGYNDVLLDGVTTDVGSRGSYAPPMDAVQEVGVQQNSVDAEYGTSAGGVLNVSMKSGTNDFHGTAYYFGRNPALDALVSAVTRTPAVERTHIWGGTVGGPIIKNRLFFFQSWEQWRQKQPEGITMTVPTAAQKQGDFSQSLNADGTLRTIYDPYTTVYNPALPPPEDVKRTPFPGNVIPQDRMDPTARTLMGDFWQPNNPGLPLTGANNFNLTFARSSDYWNFSNRVDYNINDRMRMYGRYSKFDTTLDTPNYGGGSPAVYGDGGRMNAQNLAVDFLYNVKPNMVLDIRYGMTRAEDDYFAGWGSGVGQWQKLWPNHAWYTPATSGLGSNLYFPFMCFSGVGGGSCIGATGYWLYHPRMHDYQVSLSLDHGIHHIKMGHSLRYQWENSALPDPTTLSFSNNETASTFENPDVSSGDPYASLLLGTLHDGYAHITTAYNIHEAQWAAYFQDDVKLSRRVTLNLGLRYEFESAPVSDGNRFSRGLDPTQPIAGLQQAVSPLINADLASVQWGAGLQPPAAIPYQFSGAWTFTDSSHPGLYNPQHNVFLPRVGVAFRLNDRTALRAGFARYAVPMINARSFGWNIPFYGYDRQTNILPQVEGVPQAVLSDPFPDATNPVKPAVGKALGTATNLGDTSSWFNQNPRTPINDRINISVQRELPAAFVLDATFFVNRGRNIVPPGIWGGQGYGQPMNMTNPNLIYQYKGVTQEQVANPFYQYGTPDTFPGALRDQQTIPVQQLLRPYPQYGDLTQLFMSGFRDHYYAMQLQGTRPFKNGLTLSVGYNYNQEHFSQWFNDLDKYANHLTMLECRNTPDQAQDCANPSHRMTVAGSYQLPFGKGRKYLSNTNRVLDGILGGWTTGQLFTWNGGPLLLFPGAQVTTPPRMVKKSSQWFDGSGMQILPSYTPRTNPWYYSGIRGPRVWNIDSTLSKYFSITERVKLEFRMEAYNLFNHFIPVNPSTDPSNPGTLGVVGLNQANYGRELQYAARIHF